MLLLFIALVFSGVATKAILEKLSDMSDEEWLDNLEPQDDNNFFILRPSDLSDEDWSMQLQAQNFNFADLIEKSSPEASDDAKFVIERPSDMTDEEWTMQQELLAQDFQFLNREDKVEESEENAFLIERPPGLTDNEWYIQQDLLQQDFQFVKKDNVTTQAPVSAKAQKYVCPIWPWETNKYNKSRVADRIANSIRGSYNPIAKVFDEAREEMDELYDLKVVYNHEFCFRACCSACTSNKYKMEPAQETIPAAEEAGKHLATSESVVTQGLASYIMPLIDLFQSQRGQMSARAAVKNLYKKEPCLNFCVSDCMNVPPYVYPMDQ